MNHLVIIWWIWTFILQSSCLQQLLELHNYIYLLHLFTFLFFYLLTSMYIWSLKCLELSVCSPNMLSWYVQGQFQLYITFTFTYTFTFTSVPTSACTFNFLYSHSGKKGISESLRTYQYFATIMPYALSNLYLTHETSTTGF